MLHLHFRAFVRRGRAWLPAIVAGIAAAAMVRGYLANRSLWLDEAMLALNITERHALLEPLQYSQAAPVGFLALVKAVCTLAGSTNELALRLVSLLAAIGAMLATGGAVRRLVSPRAATLAMALVGLAPAMLFFASEFKPYALDAAVAALLLWLFSLPSSRLTTAGLTVAGSAAVWCSFPSVFVVAGVWMAVLVRERRSPLGFAAACAGGAVTLASFYGAYTVTRAMVPAYGVLQDYWAAGMIPFPPRTPHDVALALDRILGMFAEPWDGRGDQWSFGTRAGLVFLLAWVAGVAWLWRRQRATAVAIVLPLLLLVVAASAGKYPISTRLLAFLMPLLAMGASAGLESLFEHPSRFATGVLLATGLLTLPAVGAVQWLRDPAQVEEIRPAIAMIKTEWQPQDRIYLHAGSVPAWRYYRRMGLVPADLDAAADAGARSRSDYFAYLGEVCAIGPQGRVWVLVSHALEVETAFLRSSFQRFDIVEQEATWAGTTVFRLDSTLGDGWGRMCGALE